MEWDFGSTMISVLLAGVFYILVMFFYKVMGRRELGQLSIFDFIMNLVMANVVAAGIIDENVLWDSLGGLLIMVALQIFMAKLQMKKPKIRDRIDGAPILVIKNGSIDFRDLKRTKIQLDEVMMLLREAQISAIEEIQYAIFEPNGTFSIYKNETPAKYFPLPFIVSGVIKDYALKSMEKDKEWLLRQLSFLPYQDLQDIKFLFYKEEEHFAIYTKAGMKTHEIRV